MLKPTTALLAATLLAAAAAPAEASDSLHITRSVFTAEKDSQKHPALLTQTITINQEVSVPRVCIAYENTSKKSQGWGVANVQIMRMDGTEESVRLANQVDENVFVKCTKAKQVADFVPGDMLVFEYTFENMLRLRRSGDTTDHVKVNAVAVADGFPLYVHEVGIEQGEEEKGKKGGWLHAANLNFQATKKKQKHPKALSKMVVMQHDVNAPNVCSLYRNTFNKGGKGTVTTNVSFYRDDEMFDSLTLKAKVKKNTVKECTVGQDLVAGDVIFFDFEFTGMPRMAKKKKKTDYAEVNGAIVDNGTPEFTSPPGDDGSSPSPDPSPDPSPAPSPSGGLSSADIAAAGKLLIANRPVQLWRSKSSWGRGKWWVIGPRTRIDMTQLGNVVAGTVGFGNTIAAAVADYEKKMGSLASGGSLSSADVAGLVWYDGINSSGGPTSVRKSPSGGFYGEYYRPGRGALHNGPYKSPAQALDWLKKQGL